MGTVQLFNADCLTVLPALAAGSVDAVVTDPPYGIGENNHRNMSRANAAAAVDYGKFDWDEERVSDVAIQEILRVSKSQVIFGGNYFSDLLPPSAGWIVWDKERTGDFADFEMAWTSHKRAGRMFRYMWNGMIKAKPEPRCHPTQKPLALMDWVIENYTKPGDTVLDCFMGSGTTGMACLRLGRSFVGIERDPAYFAIAQRRIAEAQAQLRMEI